SDLQLVRDETGLRIVDTPTGREIPREELFVPPQFRGQQPHRMASRTRRPASPALTGTALVETLLGGWRARSRLEVDGFAVLRSRGETRRPNSVVPLAPSPAPAAPDAAVARFEGHLDAAGERRVFLLFTGECLDHEPVRA